MKVAIVTGSAGLIGSQASIFFNSKGYKIIGIDNNMRKFFFGDDASTEQSKNKLITSLGNNYIHYDCDIRDYEGLEQIFKKYSDKIEIVIHTAAQPSHDLAASMPLIDFSVNATGTMNMLELTRLNCPKATFIFTSTNKVYGDRPNFLEIKELETRWEIRNDNYQEDVDFDGIGFDGSVNEYLSIDNTKHSVFGASKVAADIMCQEYGKYFNMNVGIFRGGCLTGPNHAGTELHGFLSYLVKCIVHNKPYTIFGFKGKQVRDNIHSWDLINMFWEFHNNPRQGEVYNAGGGRDNSTSILEAIETINRIAGTNWNNYKISEENRIGDHIWYISDLTKFKKDYPNWDITISLEETIKQMVEFEKNKINQ
jgi:CDP-paratose 2-epimerase